MNPFSFDAIRHQVMKVNPHVPRIHTLVQASPEQEVEGVRSTAAQGTSSQANTPDPLDPSRPLSGPRRPFTGLTQGWDDTTEQPPEAYFDAEHVPAYDNAEGNTVQVDRWPPNPSREVINPSIGHTEQLRTDASLQVGPGPGRIERYMPMRIYGIANGMTTGVRGGEGFPWNADLDHIDHVDIARQALPTKGPQKLADDNVPIPAVYAGNPR